MSDNWTRAFELILSQLKSNLIINHKGEYGRENEALLRKFLDDRLPEKYAVGSGFAIDAFNNQSAQIDIIIYDILNAVLLYRGETNLIVPVDNVAAAISIKTTLDKNELINSLENIKSIKELKKTILNQGETGQQINLHNKTMGIVFAFQSETSLESIAGNWSEYYEKIPLECQTDFVIIMDQGVVTHAFKDNRTGNIMPASIADDIMSYLKKPDTDLLLTCCKYDQSSFEVFFHLLISYLSFFNSVLLPYTPFPYSKKARTDVKIIKTIREY